MKTRIYAAPAVKGLDGRDLFSLSMSSLSYIAKKTMISIDNIVYNEHIGAYIVYRYDLICITPFFVTINHCEMI